MADKEQLAVLRQGVDAWNAWREQNTNVRVDLSRGHLGGLHLAEANFSGAYLRYTDFSKANLRRANLSGATLWNANLSETNLTGANLFEAEFLEANLTGANLAKLGSEAQRASFLDANLTGANLTRADLFYVGLSGANLSGANLTGANLSGEILDEELLRYAKLSGTKLRGKSLTGVNLTGANLTGANLSGSILRGVILEVAELPDANLSGADLSGQNLCGTNLSEANLSEANLTGANLTAADLSGADLTFADISDADLTSATLCGAYLSRAHLIGTNLTAAELRGSYVYGTSAWDLKLDGADQRNLIITPHGEPEITVDNLEVAQFVYLLLNNERVRHVIDTITSKVVLILGRFTPERKVVLNALREELRQRDYTPVLFDFGKPRSRSTLETVSTLAHMARFVIADLTDARSVLQELQAVVPTNPSVPVQPLIIATQEEPGMFDFFRKYPWMLEPYRYPGSTALLAALTDRVIAPVELVLSKADPPRRPVR